MGLDPWRAQGEAEVFGNKLLAGSVTGIHEAILHLLCFLTYQCASWKLVPAARVLILKLDQTLSIELCSLALDFFHHICSYIF